MLSDYLFHLTTSLLSPSIHFILLIFLLSYPIFFYILQLLPFLVFKPNFTIIARFLFYFLTFLLIFYSFWLSGASDIVFATLKFFITVLFRSYLDVALLAVSYFIPSSFRS